MKKEELLIYIDGEYFPKSEAKISVYNHGFLYGDGIFEGIRAYSGNVFKLREHIDRLYSSAKAIMLDIPLTKDQMLNAVVESLKKNGLYEDSYIRLVVSRGEGDLGLDPRKCPKPTVIIITDEIKLHGREAKENGLTAIITWVKRDPVDATSHEIKSLNYLNSILAKLEANNAQVDEAICLNKEGFVCEGVAENIFIVSNDVVVTPPTSTGALRGITRQVAIEIAEALGYVVVKKDITPADLFLADEAFFTGTAAEIVPVVEINKRKIGDGKPGSVTKRLMEKYHQLVKDPDHGVPVR
ncbi:branched-chain-amino-acid transaminase [Candidatus Bathyarchaeota archaeon]|nr:branched-chain-amino-acid transaminase [Candidatus Bathyarchaeota archaeon]MCK5630954.1 branched-chain-amino-acid transaminase [Candidatus Bathyarchaeota archaeon]